jgi:hypothetical protein
MKYKEIKADIINYLGLDIEYYYANKVFLGYLIDEVIEIARPYNADFILSDDLCRLDRIIIIEEICGITIYKELENERF